MLTKLNETGQFVCLAFASIGTAIVSFLGGWDMLLYILLSCIAIDYVSGVIVAIVEKKLSSAVGYKGIAKKVFILVLVGLATLVGQALGVTEVRTVTVLFYIANEGISILENASKLDVPYPQKLKDILAQLKKDNDASKDETKKNAENNDK